MEHKGVFTDGDKMLRGGAQRIKKLTKKGDSDKDVGVSIGNQSTPRDEQTAVGNRIPISLHSRVSSYTTRKLRTGDELFPGDICRPGSSQTTKNSSDVASILIDFLVKVFG
ncbi:hypothetical protein Tco_0774145 [Tanacetum coccineum]|uniref:Uncharacterized protein n=1 Tax=Tanacetum coccineum TaxID=301880 RepID=A0ABQ4ZMQ4_9ASTR